MQCDNCKEVMTGDYITVIRDGKKLNYHQACVRCSKCDGEVGTNIYFSYPSGKTYCGTCRIEREKTKKQEPPRQQAPAGGCTIL